ncbi:hypothetical protein BR93DRAFT_393480 [Coniochaeta sp. PMI_546]|nr:hypothetical protein BR93DRAFT_393480 [Coniochaeta sp. PMI_546]
MTMATLPLSLVLILSALCSPAVALKPRFHAAQRDATAVSPSSRASITEAPSQAAVDLRLRYAADALERRVELSIDSCATACINAAVTKSTNCKVGDWSCECSETNQAYIEAGALSCVYQRCGYAVGANVFSEAADFCLSFNNGEYSTDATTSVSTIDATNSKSVVVVTKTDSTGSTSFSTTVVNAPTGSSSGSSGGNGGSSTSSSSSSNPGLSTGAIVGIAVGAAAGGIIVCVAIFFIWRSCLRKPQRQPISYAPVSHIADDAAAAYPPPPGGRAEIDGTSTLVASTASPSPAPGRDNLSKLPSVMSTTSPAPPPPVSPVVSTASPPPPAHPLPATAYPNMAELQGYGQNVSNLHGQAWQQQQYQAQYANQPQQGVYTTTEYRPPAGYAEVEGARPPEMQGDTYITQELHGQHVTPELHGAPTGR